MARAIGNNTFLQRLIGAMALDAAIYEEVEADRMATGQAFLVVLMSSVATGIGARGVSEQSVASIVFFSIVALMAWAAWALVTFVIGTLLLPEAETRSDVGELLRTIGFASTPGSASGPGRAARGHHSGVRGNRDLDAGRDDRRRPAGARLPQHGPRRGRLRARLGALGHAGHRCSASLFGPSVS